MAATARGLVDRVRTAGAPLLDLVTPPLCPNCGERLGLPLCSFCEKDLALLGSPCERCRSATSLSSCPCLLCWDGPPQIPLCVTGWYRGTLSDLVVRAKWGRETPLVSTLAHWGARAAQQGDWHREFAGGGFDGWVPVPRDPWRLLRHGQPLSERAGAPIGRALGLARFPPPRRSWRPPQQNLSGSVRRHNLDGALSYSRRRGRAIVGKRVLIIDDVWTTGSTIRECARALRVAGASACAALVLAAR